MRVLFWLLAGMLLLTETAGAAEREGSFPTPAQAGFHHCALIYDRSQRGVSELMPFVARVEDGKPQEWLFDAYLFLIFSSPRGIGTSDGPTTQVDWQYQLDRWFTPGRDLAALDAAIGSAAGDLGLPAAKRQIILTIPYINRSVTDFGDVDADGKTEDLSTPQGRSSVLRWYLGETRKRFAAGSFRHLTLWGFYWMNEGVSPADEPSLHEAAKQVHAAGERFLWIPWYRAPGWERWREHGFDVALMQPNYAFGDIHQGRVRRNRLAITAGLARSRGMGVEMEAGGIIAIPADRRAFLQYLADGAPDRLGYQAGATAYYLGDDTVQRVLASPEPNIRSLYDSLADYVSGRKVPDPQRAIAWKTASDTTLGSDYLAKPVQVASAETQFAEPRSIGAAEVHLADASARAPWVGSIVAEVMLPGTSTWTPAGWTIRAAADEGAASHQAVTLPVNRTVSALRFSFHPLFSSAMPGVRAISTVDGNDVPTRAHLALSKPYQFIPAPEATYPDSDHELTDGVISQKGFQSGETVGWLDSQVAVCFDLQRVYPVDRIEVHCQRGGYASVQWPTFAAAALSAAAVPPTGLQGVGELPKDLRWSLMTTGVSVDRRRSDQDLDGHLTLATPRTPARYVNVLLENDAWLMISEIRIYSAGQNIAPKGIYTLRPPPTSNVAKAKYADDGRRLTDGIVAGEFVPAQVTGWDTHEARELKIDLGSEQPITEVIAWCLGGGHAGIFAPAGVEVELSADGSNWAPAAKADKPAIVEQGKSQCEPVAYRMALSPGQNARWLKVKIRNDKGWSMVSEIEVH